MQTASARKPGAKNAAQPSPDAHEWIATREACEILGRSRSTVFSLANRGLLTMNRPGRSQPRFKRSEVVAMAKSNGMQVS